MFIQKYLQEIISKLFKSEGKLTNIAKNYAISPSLMTYLNIKLQNALDHHHGFDNLVDQP
ncbi:hypothetical protein [Candidatus Harpocratesius sp.]